MIELPLIFISAILIIASYVDIRQREIPNWLTYPIIISTLIWLDLKLIIGFAFAILLILLSQDLFGAGDIKLGFIIWSWSENFNWPQDWILIALLLGGLWGGFALLLRGEKTLPFAPFLAVGFIAVNLAV